MSDENNNQDSETDHTEAMEGVCEFIGNVLKLAGYDAHPHAEFDGNNILVKIDGPDSESLVMDDKGRYHPEVGDAIASLARRAIDERNTPPIVVDAANYRARRLEQLEGLAEVLADYARNGRRVDVFGLDSVERRTVHRELSDHEGIESTSDGHGVCRCLSVQ